jgi:hypothetical protein
VNDAARSAGGNGARDKAAAVAAVARMSVSEIRDHHSGTQVAPGFHFVHPSYKLQNTPSPPRPPAVRDLPPGGKQNCCRGAISRPSFAHGGEWRTARSPDERQRNPEPAFKLASRSRISRSLSSGRPLRAGPVGTIRATKEKGGGTPADAIHPLAASADAARVRRDALACRRSAAALA